MRSITRKMVCKRACCGFTLVELMIVLVIAAVLAAVAFPSYQEYVRKTKRTEAQAALMRLMQQQERYFSQNNTYIAFSVSTASTDANAQKFRWYSGESAVKSAYEINGAACDGGTVGDCIELTATPGTANVDSRFSDSHCGALKLRSTGIKSADATDCWR